MQRLGFASLLAAAALLVPALAAAQPDFDPGGRNKPPRGQPDGGGGGRNKPPRGEGDRGPGVDELIKRYVDIALKQPGEPFPLLKLGELYRQRDGNVDKLVEDFTARAAADGPDKLNARLVLAGVLINARRFDEARASLEATVAERPTLDTPKLMLARLAAAQGDRATARQQYEAALPLVTGSLDREKVTRELMLLCLDLKDFDAAKARHTELVRAAGGSLFVMRELGRELLAREEYARAETEFREVVRTASGDTRALAPALKDLGVALARQKKMDEALETLKRARDTAGQSAGLRAEILSILTEVYREEGKLTDLIAVLETEHDRDFQREATVASLYEETGSVDKAITAYRDALKIDGDSVYVRVKLVHLLQSAGQLEEAIKEYEALVKAAPENPEYVFELADTFIQRGDRKKALALVEDLERRTRDEPDLLAAVADFYERIEEPKKALDVLEKLAGSSGSDPQYLVDLGDRYFQDGDVKRAVETWKRILTAVSNRARAQAMLGETYLDHDMADEALEAMREAVKLAPGQVRYKKALASALERVATATQGGPYRYTEALQMWEEILRGADEPTLEREARTHIVTLWSIQRQLAEKVGPLSARFAGSPPDLSAGRLLAEVQRRLNKLPDAEATLRSIVEKAPGDESSLLALERVLVSQRKLPEGIEVLKKLVDVNDKAAREYYQRMSQYASELYLDDDAIAYAAKAVERSPDDASGHHRLGLMYRRRQNIERAMQELRAAISKNDRLFPAYFDLAELYMSSGQVDEADRLYRAVVRMSRDEEFVIRAARLSMQVNLGRGTLESLERELLPVALGNPQKTIYRRLLVELYGAMAFPLVHAARLGSGETAAAAKQKLAEVGTRAVKPLLDALADDKQSQQRVAIEVLAYVQNKGAGPALMNFATGQADRDLRVRAMVACGALDDPALLPRFEQLLAPDENSDTVAGDAVSVAAAWGVARMRSPKAARLLDAMLRSPSPDVRALGAVGVGLLGDKTRAAALGELVRSPQAGPAARAAAAYALGRIGDDSQKALLLALSDSSDVDVALAALQSLARLEQGPAGVAELGPIVARRLLSEEPDVRRFAVSTATALVRGEKTNGDNPLAVPDGAVVVSEVLRGLAPGGYAASEQALALAALKEALVKEARAAVATSPERAAIVAEVVANGLRPLVDLLPSEHLADGERAALEGVAEAMAVATTPGFVALARHPSAEVRRRALEFLAKRSEPEAQATIVVALGEDDASLVRTALGAIGTLHSDELAAAVSKQLESAEAWSIRAAAAEAIGRMWAAGTEPEPATERAIEKAATSDAFALVREAALRAAAKGRPDFTRPLATRIAASDAEPRLRELADGLARQP